MAVSMNHCPNCRLNTFEIRCWTCGKPTIPGAIPSMPISWESQGYNGFDKYDVRQYGPPPGV